MRLVTYLKFALIFAGCFAVLSVPADSAFRDITKERYDVSAEAGKLFKLLEESRIGPGMYGETRWNRETLGTEAMRKEHHDAPNCAMCHSAPSDDFSRDTMRDVTERFSPAAQVADKQPHLWFGGRENPQIPTCGACHSG